MKPNEKMETNDDIKETLSNDHDDVLYEHDGTEGVQQLIWYMLIFLRLRT